MVSITSMGGTMRIQIFLSSTCLLLAVVFISIFSFAQWDQDDEVQRLKEYRRDQTIEQADRKIGIGLPQPNNKITKSEEKFIEFSNVPTGYLYREFVIRQNVLRGKWGKTAIVPAEGFETDWGYIDQEKYEKSFAKGLTDEKLKNTIYAPYYNDMKKACSKDIAAKGVVHVRVSGESQGWMTQTENTPPYDLHRELRFQCMSQGDKK